MVGLSVPSGILLHPQGTLDTLPPLSFIPVSQGQPDEALAIPQQQLVGSGPRVQGLLGTPYDDGQQVPAALPAQNMIGAGLFGCHQPWGKGTSVCPNQKQTAIRGRKGRPLTTTACSTCCSLAPSPLASLPGRSVL